VTEDAAKRPYRLYRHALGRAEDELVYEEQDELYRLRIERTRDRKYLLANIRSSTTSEVRAAPSDRPGEPLRVLLPREEGHEYDVDHRDGQFYIRTNRDAKYFRLVAAPADDPSPPNWKELVPHRPGVALEDVNLFRGHAVLAE